MEAVPRQRSVPVAGFVGMLNGCLKVTDGHQTTRLEEDMAFMSQVSPDFSMVDPLVRAELNMGPRSKPNCSRKRLGTLAGVGGGQRRHFRVSCLGQLARAQDSYLPVYLGSFPPNPASSMWSLHEPGFAGLADRTPSPELISNSELRNIFLKTRAVYWLA